MLKDQKEQTEHQGQGLGQKLIRNTLFNFLGQFYILVLGIAVVPYVVHRLGAGLYGVLVLVATIGGFGTMLNLGMGNALTKYISEYYWQKDFERIRSLFQTALAVCLFGGVTCFLLLLGFKARISAWLFHGDVRVQPFISIALWITAFGFLLSTLTEALAAIPMGLQRFDISNRINVITATIRSLGMIAALLLGFFVRAILGIYIVAGLTAVVAYIYYGCRLVPGLRLRPKFDFSIFRRLIGYSVPVLIASLAALIVHRFDRVLVAYFLSISAVSFYVIPYALAEKSQIGVGNITSVIFPSASELAAMRAGEGLKELYVRATKMVILAILPATAILVAFPAQILQWWVGPEYAVRGALVLQLVAVGFLLNILGHVPYYVTQAIGRPWTSAKFSFLNAIVNLSLFLVLIPRFGIVGAAVGFLISEAFVTPMLVREANRILNVRWRSLICRSYLRPFACGLVTLGTLWVLQSYAISLPKLILCSLLGLAVYCILALVIAIDSREKDGIRDHILQMVRSYRNALNAGTVN